MKKNFEKIVIFIVGVYLLIRDNIEMDNKYQLYKKIYIENKYVKESDINNKYLVSNASRWKKSINNTINVVDKKMVKTIIKEAKDIHHKIFKK